MVHIGWYVGAALAVALDAGRPEGLAFLSQCGSASLLSAATYAIDPGHVRALPFTTAWMLVGCLLPGVLSQRPATGQRRHPLRLALAALGALALAMPLSCMVGWLVAQWLPLDWPGALSVATWAGAMLLSCAGLMHFFVWCGSLRLRASVAAPSSSSPSLTNRSLPC
jgi:hypothetical protein